MTKLFVLLLMVSSYFGLGQRNGDQILRDWTIAYNSQSQDQMLRFINKNYHSDLLSKISIEDHVKFYQSMIDDFGKVNPTVYKVIGNTPSKFVVHLVKEGIPIAKDDVRLEDILVIEIDLKEGLLSKGLGLGSLLCYMKK